MEKLIQKILNQHKYKRRIIDNDGTPQISLNNDANDLVGIQDEARVELRYSSKHSWFYYVIFPPGQQPTPKELEDVIENVIED